MSRSRGRGCLEVEVGGCLEVEVGDCLEVEVGGCLEVEVGDCLEVEVGGCLEVEGPSIRFTNVVLSGVWLDSYHLVLVFLTQRYLDGHLLQFFLKVLLSSSSLVKFLTCLWCRLIAMLPLFV